MFNRLSSGLFGTLPGLLLVVLSLEVLAEEPGKFVPGCRVLATRADVALYDGEKVVGTTPAGANLDVIKVEGTWLWVGRGWLRSADVIPTADGVSYFTERLSREKTPFGLASRAKAYCENGNYQAAVADCTAVLGQSPEFIPALICRASAYLDLGSTRLAIDDLNRAIQVDSKTAAAYSLRGQARINVREFDQAMTDLETAIRLDPKSCASWARRGMVWSQQVHFKEAIGDFDTALRLNPYYVVALNNRANVWFKQGEFRRAVDDYTAALRMRPTAEELYFNRAIAWDRLGDHARAIKDYSEAIRINPRLRQPIITAPIFIWSRGTVLGRRTISNEQVRWCRVTRPLEPIRSPCISSLVVR